MRNKCRAVIAATLPDLLKALQSQGLLFPASEPGLLHRIEVRKNMLVVRFP
ncbi:hypothetical protein KKQ11_00315 [Pseudomonas sp. MG-2]|uniref:hypothetical protein n=1 Tax=Pseudomonas TaxID=286 RepID=UPI0015FBDC42|nr:MULTISPECIES: hypothetical protein [Pseudomonas]MBA6090060.1 hypothetical protein [Pseudomonas monteilii]MBT9234265.1 hypothetical protein [Pseudomonas sp. MG-2]